MAEIIIPRTKNYREVSYIWVAHLDFLAKVWYSFRSARFPSSACTCTKEVPHASCDAHGCSWCGRRRGRSDDVHDCPRLRGVGRDHRRWSPHRRVGAHAHPLDLLRLPLLLRGHRRHGHLQDAPRAAAARYAADQVTERSGRSGWCGRVFTDNAASTSAFL